MNNRNQGIALLQAKHRREQYVKINDSGSGLWVVIVAALLCIFAL